MSSSEGCKSEAVLKLEVFRHNGALLFVTFKVVWSRRYNNRCVSLALLSSWCYAIVFIEGQISLKDKVASQRIKFIADDGGRIWCQVALYVDHASLIKKLLKYRA